MIRDRQEQLLFMDFSGIETKKGHPSDLDMWYILDNGLLIIGEIKSSKGRFGKFQRMLIERLISQHKGGGTALYIEHTKDVHKGDTEVDVSKCYVKEYLWHGEWIVPQKPITVNEAFRILQDYGKKGAER